MGVPQHLPFPAQIPFAIVPVNIMMSALLSHAERATWQALALHAGGPQKPYARPGVPTLARIAGYSERQVRRSLRSLERVGAITLYREQPGLPNEYWLNFSFGVDELEFMALMQERAERQLDPAEGIREVVQTELALFKEAEQLSLMAEQEPPTPDTVTGGADSQVSGGADSQVSAEQTSDQPGTPPPCPDTPPPPAPAKPETETVIMGGGVSLSLTDQDLADVAACVEESVPVFDGLMGRPSAAEVVDAALCVPWLGKKFSMDLRGVRAHCLSYARIEAKRHWQDALEDKLSSAVVTRTRTLSPESTPAPEPEPLPEGLSVSELMATFKRAGKGAVEALLDD